MNDELPIHKQKESTAKEQGDERGESEKKSIDSEERIKKVAKQLKAACDSMQEAGVSRSLESARTLFAARQSLSESEFEQLWGFAAQEMGFKFDLEKFLYVGEKLGDLERDLYGNLPQHWAILYCLAQVDRQVIRAGVSTEKIHRAMSLREAEQFLGVSRYGPTGPCQDEDPAMYVLDDLTDGLVELGLSLDGPQYPPEAYSFSREIEPHDWLLSLELLEDDKGIFANGQIFLSSETTEYVEWTRKLPLNVTAKKIYDAMLRRAKEVDKPGFRSKYRVSNMD